jgi:rRNA-processing protein FCF1
VQILLKKENLLIHEELDILNYRKIMVANCIMEKIKIMSQNAKLTKRNMKYYGGQLHHGKSQYYHKKLNLT